LLISLTSLTYFPICKISFNYILVEGYKKLSIGREFSGRLKKSRRWLRSKGKGVA